MGDGAEGDDSLKAVGGTYGVSPYCYYGGGSILLTFLSLGQGEPLPRTGISPDYSHHILCILSCIAHQLASTKGVFDPDL